MKLQSEEKQKFRESITFSSFMCPPCGFNLRGQWTSGHQVKSAYGTHGTLIIYNTVSHWTFEPREL